MKTWSEFLAMGGYGLYVWGSVFVCFGVVLAELWTLRIRRRKLTLELAREDQAVESV